MSGNLDPVNNIALQQKEALAKAARALARQESASESFTAACEEAFNPWAADAYKKQMRALEERTQDAKAIAKEAKSAVKSDPSSGSAERYEKQNPELSARSLKQLLGALKEGDSQEELLDKVLAFFPDKSLADEALDFLIENTQPPLQTTLQETKKQFNSQFGREIISGKNIAADARSFAGEGMGSPSDLRDLYRDITGTPREPVKLFDELSSQYDFQKLKNVIQFLLHSLGSDLRSKGPSIERGELARLFAETRSLQAILGVYRFFQGRMGLVGQLFADAELELPPSVTFETLAKLLIKMLQDRYPAAAKVLTQAGTLGVAQLKPALIIIISQWRDAIRGISPRLYKTLKGRDELFAAIIEALTELEKDEEEA